MSRKLTEAVQPRQGVLTRAQRRDQGVRPRSRSRSQERRQHVTPTQAQPGVLKMPISTTGVERDASSTASIFLALEGYVAQLLLTAPPPSAQQQDTTTRDGSGFKTLIHSPLPGTEHNRAHDAPIAAAIARAYPTIVSRGDETYRIADTLSSITIGVSALVCKYSTYETLHSTSFLQIALSETASFYLLRQALMLECAASLSRSLKRAVLHEQTMRLALAASWRALQNGASLLPSAQLPGDGQYLLAALQFDIVYLPGVDVRTRQQSFIVTADCFAAASPEQNILSTVQKLRTALTNTLVRGVRFLFIGPSSGSSRVLGAFAAITDPVHQKQTYDRAALSAHEQAELSRVCRRGPTRVTGGVRFYMQRTAELDSVMHEYGMPSQLVQPFQYYAVCSERHGEQLNELAGSVTHIGDIEFSTGNGAFGPQRLMRGLNCEEQAGVCTLLVLGASWLRERMHQNNGNANPNQLLTKVFSPDALRLALRTRVFAYDHVIYDSEHAHCSRKCETEQWQNLQAFLIDPIKDAACVLECVTAADSAASKLTTTERVAVLRASAHLLGAWFYRLIQLASSCNSAYSVHLGAAAYRYLHAYYDVAATLLQVVESAVHQWSTMFNSLSATEIRRFVAHISACVPRAESSLRQNTRARAAVRYHLLGPHGPDLVGWSQLLSRLGHDIGRVLIRQPIWLSAAVTMLCIDLDATTQTGMVRLLASIEPVFHSVTHLELPPYIDTLLSPRVLGGRAQALMQTLKSCFPEWVQQLLDHLLTRCLSIRSPPPHITGVVPAVRALMARHGINTDQSVAPQFSGLLPALYLAPHTFQDYKPLAVDPGLLPSHRSSRTTDEESLNMNLDDAVRYMPLEAVQAESMEGDAQSVGDDSVESSCSSELLSPDRNDDLILEPQSNEARSGSPRPNSAFLSQTSSFERAVADGDSVGESPATTCTLSFGAAHQNIRRSTEIQLPAPLDLRLFTCGVADSPALAPGIDGLADRLSSMAQRRIDLKAQSMRPAEPVVVRLGATNGEVAQDVHVAAIHGMVGAYALDNSMLTLINTRVLAARADEYEEPTWRLLRAYYVALRDLLPTTLGRDHGSILQTALNALDFEQSTQSAQRSPPPSVHRWSTELNKCSQIGIVATANVKKSTFMSVLCARQDSFFLRTAAVTRNPQDDVVAYAVREANDRLRLRLRVPGALPGESPPCGDVFLVHEPSNPDQLAPGVLYSDLHLDYIGLRLIHVSNENEPDLTDKAPVRNAGDVLQAALSFCTSDTARNTVLYALIFSLEAAGMAASLGCFAAQSVYIQVALAAAAQLHERAQTRARPSLLERLREDDLTRPDTLWILKQMGLPNVQPQDTPNARRLIATTQRFLLSSAGSSFASSLQASFLAERTRQAVPSEAVVPLYMHAQSHLFTIFTRSLRVVGRKTFDVMPTISPLDDLDYLKGITAAITSQARQKPDSMGNDYRLLDSGIERICQQKGIIPLSAAAAFAVRWPDLVPKTLREEAESLCVRGTFSRLTLPLKMDVTEGRATNGEVAQEETTVPTYLALTSECHLKIILVPKTPARIPLPRLDAAVMTIYVELPGTDHLVEVGQDLFAHLPVSDPTQQPALSQLSLRTLSVEFIGHSGCSIHTSRPCEHPLSSPAALIPTLILGALLQPIAFKNLCAAMQRRHLALQRPGRPRTTRDMSAEAVAGAIYRRDTPTATAQYYYRTPGRPDDPEADLCDELLCRQAIEAFAECASGGACNTSVQYESTLAAGQWPPTLPPCGRLALTPRMGPGAAIIRMLVCAHLSRSGRCTASDVNILLNHRERAYELLLRESDDVHNPMLYLIAQVRIVELTVNALHASLSKTHFNIDAQPVSFSPSGVQDDLRLISDWPLGMAILRSQSPLQSGLTMSHDDELDLLQHSEASKNSRHDGISFFL